MEALALSIVASFVGLGNAQVGLRLGQQIMEDELGLAFWVDYGAEPLTVLFTIGVAVFTAVIVGVVPALKATGRKLQLSLRFMSGGAMRLGKTWTALVIGQVALAVAVLPAAVGGAWTELREVFNKPEAPARITRLQAFVESKVARRGFDVGFQPRTVKDQWRPLAQQACSAVEQAQRCLPGRNMHHVGA